PDDVAARETAHATSVDDLELLPAQPPTHDVVPWLTRRLSQLVDEAAQIRSAAQASLAPPAEKYTRPTPEGQPS
ncbi:MAG: hypothetical protein M3Y55_01165, partial [Pseudomonadota bacterium]|nr:hypothetical protein [Pseudomonadota bacterium]